MTTTPTSKSNNVARSVRIGLLPTGIEDSNGADVRDILHANGPESIHRVIEEAKPAEEFLRESTEDGQPAEPPPFTHLLSSAELVALDTKPRFLIRDILVAGQPGVIGGRSKSLKTSAAIDLAVSLGSGRAFLGHFPAEKLNVAFWSGESGSTTIQETARRVAKAKGIDLAGCSVDWGFRLPILGMPAHLSALATIIQERHLEVALIDPLYLSLMGLGTTVRSSDLFSMGPLLLPLSEIGQATGCTILVLHHFRKTGQVDEAEPAALEELSQSGVAEWARQWLLLARRSPYQADGRHELWMRTGGSAGHAGLWAVDITEGLLDPDTFTGRKWDVEVKAVADARDQAKREKEDRRAKEQERREEEHCLRLLDALQQFPDGETPKQLRAAAHLNPDNFDRAVFTLQRLGRVVACSVPKTKGLFDGFRLKT